MKTCALLALALPFALPAAPEAPPFARGEWVGVTTGDTDHLSGQLVAVDPKSGKARKLAAIVPAGGQRYASDLVFTTDRKALLVSIVEIGDNRGTSELAEVDWTSGKVLRASPKMPGALDALCWTSDGKLLATLSESRPQKLVALDPATGARTEIGTLDEKLWVRSLAFAPDGALWALSTRAGEADRDALVKLDPANGKTLAQVELETKLPALALEIDARGRVLVAVDDEKLHEIDPATGKSKSSVALAGFRAVGFEPVR